MVGPQNPSYSKIFPYKSPQKAEKAVSMLVPLTLKVHFLDCLWSLVGEESTVPHPHGVLSADWESHSRLLPPDLRTRPPH